MKSKASQSKPCVKIGRRIAYDPYQTTAEFIQTLKKLRTWDRPQKHPTDGPGKPSAIDQHMDIQETQHNILHSPSQEPEKTQGVQQVHSGRASMTGKDGKTQPIQYRPLPPTGPQHMGMQPPLSPPLTRQHGEPQKMQHNMAPPKIQQDIGVQQTVSPPLQHGEFQQTQRNISPTMQQHMGGNQQQQNQQPASTRPPVEAQQTHHVILPPMNQPLHEGQTIQSVRPPPSFQQYAERQRIQNFVSPPSIHQFDHTHQVQSRPPRFFEPKKFYKATKEMLQKQHELDKLDPRQRHLQGGQLIESSFLLPNTPEILQDLRDLEAFEARRRPPQTANRGKYFATVMGPVPTAPIFPALILQPRAPNPQRIDSDLEAWRRQTYANSVTLGPGPMMPGQVQQGNMGTKMLQTQNLATRGNYFAVAKGPAQMPPVHAQETQMSTRRVEPISSATRQLQEPKAMPTQPQQNPAKRQRTEPESSTTWQFHDPNVIPTPPKRQRVPLPDRPMVGRPGNFPYESFIRNGPPVPVPVHGQFGVGR